MYLFLEGDRGVGKSTLLREQLLPHVQALAGFAVQRLFLGGTLEGFRAVSLAEHYPDPCGIWQEEGTGVFLRKGRANPRALEQVVLAALDAARRDTCRMILLDEIGGVELIEPAIMQGLDEILSLGKPCIGVLKSADNLRHIASTAGIAQPLACQLHGTLTQRLMQNGLVVTLRLDNHDTVRATIQAYLARHMNVSMG